jgi:hypothetical protein
MSTYLNISDKIGLQSTPNPSLLNLYGGAAAAYSLRQLDYTYTGAAVNVRRDSDQTTKDIGFVNGELDTASLEAFTTETVVLFNEDFTTDSGWTLGSNTTISGGKINFVGESSYSFEGYSAAPYTKVRVTFEITDYTSGSIRFGNFGGGGSGNNVSAAGTYVQEITLGNGNQNWGFFPGGFTGSVDNFKVEVIECNAFVTTWYDQSGNGINATQSSAAAQPKIVSLGSTILENGKSAAQFDGVDDGMDMNTLFNLSNVTTSFVFSAETGQDAVLFEVNQNSSNYIAFGIGDIGTADAYGTRFRVSGVDYSAGESGVSGQKLALHIGSQSTPSVDLYLNNTEATGSQTSRAGSSGSSTFGYRSTSGNPSDAKIQEFVIYELDQSSNRSGIETNINDFYSIY